jgi:hypothetical protein
MKKGSLHASKGLFESFQKQVSLHNVKRTGDFVSADPVAGSKYPEHFRRVKQKGVMKEECFTPASV